MASRRAGMAIVVEFAAAIAVALVVAIGVAPGVARAGGVADVIVYNGTVETMNANHWRAQAMAIRAGRVVALGTSTAIVSTWRGATTRMINLGGRTALPGFVDAHAHLFGDSAALGLDFASAQQLALSRGITTISEQGIGPVMLARLRAFASSLQVRLSVYLRANDFCGALADTWWYGEAPSFTTTDMLRVIGIKVFADGGACNWAATTFYMPADTDPPDHYGNLYLEYPQMLALLSDIQAHGFQASVHAIGDRARDVVANAMATMLAGAPNTMRHRVEHNSITRPDQIDYYRAVGVVPVVWGRSSSCAIIKGASYYSQLPAGDEGWWWPWQAMLDAGLRPAWHSDVREGVPLEQFDPIQHLYGFTTRKTVAGDGTVCVPPAPVLAQVVSPWDALRMMTVYAAYALHMDAAVGTLEPGKLADFVVVEGGDPAAGGFVGDDTLKLKVVSTWVGGVGRWCAAGVGGYCR